MAKMITRTFKSTIVQYLTMNIESNEVTKEIAEIAETFTGENKTEKILKKIRKEKDTDTVKVVAVTDVTERETLRGMTEQFFLENSEELPEEQEKREARRNDK